MEENIKMNLFNEYVYGKDITLLKEKIHSNIVNAINEYTTECKQNVDFNNVYRAMSYSTMALLKSVYDMSLKNDGTNSEALSKIGEQVFDNMISNMKLKFGDSLDTKHVYSLLLIMQDMLCNKVFLEEKRLEIEEELKETKNK